MILIKNGQIFNGTKKPSFVGSLLIKSGKVERIFKQGDPMLEVPDDIETIDARGHWVTPGFIDSHTHYDFELLVNPGLTESVRHGITTVVTGSCSISAIMAAPEDCSDIFTRVEGVPREKVLPVLSNQKKWTRPKEYVQFLEKHPLGPNVCAFLGHSDLRMAAMGIERSVSENISPTDREVEFMRSGLAEALDVGFLGLSTMQSDADRLDGDRVRSKALPSVYASYSEYSELNKILRQNRRILQTAPDVRKPTESMLHLLLEVASIFRKKLRVTSLVSLDSKAARNKDLRKKQNLFSVASKLLFGDFRWQMLPCEFQAQVNGMNFVIFEEVPAGALYLHLTEEMDREKLVKNSEFRAEFKKNLTERFRPALWNRDIGDGRVFDCPDPTVVGKSFADIATESGLHVGDVFVDLLVEHGTKLKWKVVLGNEIDETLADMLNDKKSSNLVSFSDAGAHIHNIAFYNFPLQMLGRIRRMREKGINTISDEEAIHRLTGELGDWHGIDAGYIKEGGRADITILNIDEIKTSLDSIQSADFDGVDNLTRLVNRNEAIVKHVLINGKVAAIDGQCQDELGRSLDFGSFMKAK